MKKVLTKNDYGHARNVERETLSGTQKKDMHYFTGSIPFFLCVHTLSKLTGFVSQLLIFKKTNGKRKKIIDNQFMCNLNSVIRLLSSTCQYF